MQRRPARTMWIAILASSSLIGCLATEGSGEPRDNPGEEPAELGSPIEAPAVDRAALREASTEDPVHRAPRQTSLDACDAPGTWNACSATCLCGDGVGDCDDDSECVPEARCMRDVGAVYGWNPAMDVCEIGCVPADPGYLGTIDFCTSDCPCASGHGDCDSQVDCLPDLVCVTNFGPHFGFSEETDVCLSPHDDLMNGTFDHCSVDVPCASGHGDCDSHDECLPELRCGYDLGPEFGFEEDIDVCLSPHDDLMNGTADHCSVAVPCASGHGDCDGSAECLPELRCGFNLGLEFGFGAETDVCLSPHHELMNGTVDHCSIDFPCASGHGDCDGHDECLPELRCGFDRGPAFGFGEEIDVCLSPYDDLMNGTDDHCSVDFPCPADHGDCDSDEECQAGTVCIYNVGDQYGWADTIDVCQ